MMITWDLFLPFAAVSVILWTAGVAATFCNKDRCSKVALWCTAIGVIIYRFVVKSGASAIEDTWRNTPMVLTVYGCVGVDCIS